MVWLTDQKRLALFPARTIVRDPHHRESPTCREQGLNLRRIWVRLGWMRLCSSDNHYIAAPPSTYHVVLASTKYHVVLVSVFKHLKIKSKEPVCGIEVRRKINSFWQLIGNVPFQKSYLVLLASISIFVVRLNKDYILQLKATQLNSVLFRKFAIFL